MAYHYIKTCVLWFFYNGNVINIEHAQIAKSMHDFSIHMFSSVHVLKYLKKQQQTNKNKNKTKTKQKTKI